MCSFRIFLLGCTLAVCVIFGAGCELIELKKDAVTGREYTQLEQILTNIASGGEAVAPFVPGYGIILSGIASLIGMAGVTATSIVRARKNSKIANTVIEAVEVAGSQDVKDEAQKLAVNYGVQPELHRKVKSVEKKVSGNT